MKKYRINKSICAGCGACIKACPYGAVKIGNDGKAEIDPQKCRGCGTCMKVCPFGAVEEISEKKETNQNEDNLPNSAHEPSFLSKNSFDNFQFSDRKGKGMGAGKGKGRGIGPRDGRGRGQGGGGKKKII